MAIHPLVTGWPGGFRPDSLHAGDDVCGCRSFHFIIDQGANRAEILNIPQLDSGYQAVSALPVAQDFVAGEPVDGGAVGGNIPFDVPVQPAFRIVIEAMVTYLVESEIKCIAGPFE